MEGNIRPFEEFNEGTFKSESFVTIYIGPKCKLYFEPKESARLEELLTFNHKYFSDFKDPYWYFTCKTTEAKESAAAYCLNELSKLKAHMQMLVEEQEVIIENMKTSKLI